MLCLHRCCRDSWRIAIGIRIDPSSSFAFSLLVSLLLVVSSFMLDPESLSMLSVLSVLSSLSAVLLLSVLGDRGVEPAWGSPPPPQPTSVVIIIESVRPKARVQLIRCLLLMQKYSMIIRTLYA